MALLPKPLLSPKLCWPSRLILLLTDTFRPADSCDVICVYLWGGGQGAGCRVGQVLGEGSCHSAEAAGKHRGCTVHESSPIWRHHTVLCVWRPEEQRTENTLERKYTRTENTQTHDRVLMCTKARVLRAFTTYHLTIKKDIQGSDYFMTTISALFM